MFRALFEKECKQILKSLVFYIYVLIFSLFMVAEMGQAEIVKQPQPGRDDYGTKQSTNREDIMTQTLTMLMMEVSQNKFATCPVGLYKEVILSEKELEKMEQILEKCTNKDLAELEKKTIVKPAENLDYAMFQKEMELAADIIGTGSSYEVAFYEGEAKMPMTYEDALAEYKSICEKDRITDSYMRLFCDYAGIVLTILPIFMGVTRCVRDKRSKADFVIYSKSASSLQIVMSRYLSNIIMILIPILILAFVLQTPYMYQAYTLGVKPHYFAFLFYTVVWLLPSIAMVLAGAFLLTELLNGILAIIIMVLWGVVSLLSAPSLVGNFTMNLIPRWNTFGAAEQFIQQQSALWQNRMIYMLLAIVTIIVTTLIYDRKRKGGVVLHAKKH